MLSLKRIVAVAAAAFGLAVAPAQAAEISPMSVAEWSITRYNAASQNDAHACYVFQRYQSGVIGTVSGHAITPSATDGSPGAGAWVRYVTNSRNDPNKPARTIYLRPSAAYDGPDSGSNHTAYCEVWYRSLNIFGISDFYQATYAVTYWMNTSPAAVPVQWYRTKPAGPCWINKNPIEFFPC